VTAKLACCSPAICHGVRVRVSKPELGSSDLRAFARSTSGLWPGARSTLLSELPESSLPPHVPPHAAIPRLAMAATTAADPRRLLLNGRQRFVALVGLARDSARLPELAAQHPRDDPHTRSRRSRLVKMAGILTDPARAHPSHVRDAGELIGLELAAAAPDRLRLLYRPSRLAAGRTLSRLCRPWHLFDMRRCVVATGETIANPGLAVVRRADARERAR
jgi:hypothetical protein